MEGEDGYVRVEKCAPGATGDDAVDLPRLHSVHPSNCDFMRLIAFISGEYSMLCIISPWAISHTPALNRGGLIMQTLLTNTT